MSQDIFDIRFILSYIFVCCILRPLRFGLMLVLSFFKEGYLQNFNLRTLNCTAFVVSAKVWYPLPDLTTPVGWLLLLLLTVQRRYTISVKWGFGGVYVLTIGLLSFCWCRGFCHRTLSDPFHFLLRYPWKRACKIMMYTQNYGTKSNN